MKTVFRIAAAVAFLGCLYWAVSKPAFDSITAALVAFAVFIGSLVADKKASPSMSQSVSNGSTGIQAGRDVKINR